MGAAASALGMLALVAAGVVIARRQITIVSVTGQSMEPALTAGDRVLVRRARLRSVRTGQIVVVETPSADREWTGKPAGRDLARVWMIKRVAAIPGEPLPDGLPAAIADATAVPAGKLIVLGDNPPMSMDSRYLGYVPGERLLGVVVGSLPRHRSSAEAPMVVRTT
ncbi:MAG TPA: S26 family signal peptidase [Streptosporangiaceae bacterium]|nr:S26 family signal peptidase [Streptosporangiaceae bacterium]